MAAESMASEYGLYLNIGTIAALLGAVASGVWKISRIEKEIRKDSSEEDKELREHMEAQMENVLRDLRDLEHKSADRFETVRREMGEVGASIRQKIHEIEVFSRDEFATKKSLEGTVDRINQSIERLGDRLENKIDRAMFGQR